ncbi:MAG: DUF3515 domain-containing protein [Mycobacteriales bacterium]
MPVAVVVAVVLFLVADHSTSTPDRAAPSSQPAIPTGSPVSVAPVPRTAAADRACPAMLTELPGKMVGQPRRPVTGAESEYAVAWGQPPIILQCGVPKPAGLTRTSQVFDIAQVTWFTPAGASPTAPTATWTAVDREVYVRVVVPSAYPTDSVLSQVAAAIRRTMRAR